jgi:hypothetical protein
MKPEKEPFWATTGDISEPSDEKKSVGWNTTGEKPARQVFNWFWNLVSSWISYFNSFSLKSFENSFDYLNAANEEPSSFFSIGTKLSTFISFNKIPTATYQGVSSSCCINDVAVCFYVASFSGSPSVASLFFVDLETSDEIEVSPVSGTVSDICTDGDFFYTLEGSNTIAKYSNDGTLISSFVPLGGDSNQSISTDGDFLYVGRKSVSGSFPSFVSKYSTDMSGVSVWSYSDNENHKDIVSVVSPKNSSFVYFGVNGNSTRNIVKIKKSDGSLVADRLIGSDCDHLSVSENMILVSSSSGLTLVSNKLEADNLFIDNYNVTSQRANHICSDGDVFICSMQRTGTNDAMFVEVDGTIMKPLFFGNGNSSIDASRCVSTNGYFLAISGQTITSIDSETEHCCKVVNFARSGVYFKAGVDAFNNSALRRI